MAYEMSTNSIDMEWRHKFEESCPFISKHCEHHPSVVGRRLPGHQTPSDQSVEASGQT